MGQPGAQRSVPLWIRQEVQALPRAPELICAFALTAAASAAAADCVIRVEAAPDDLGWQLQIDAPCAPYAPVSITYGALQIDEETGAAGHLRITLPVLDQAVARVGGLDPAGAITVARPEGLVPGGFIWISGQSAPIGALPEVGLAARGAARPELGLYPAGQTPGALNIPVTTTQCATALRFDLLRDGWPQAQGVTVNLPDCALAGAVVSLPIGGTITRRGR